MSSRSTRVRLLVATAVAVAAGGTALAASWAVTRATADDGARAGVPVVERVHSGHTLVTVAVAPARPGRNLVRLDADGGHDSMPGMQDAGTKDATLRIGTDRHHLGTAHERPGTDGQWSVVDLPAGASTLYVAAGSSRPTAVHVDTGHGRPVTSLAGADGPECLAAVTGRLVAGDHGAVTSCPADRLGAADRQAVTYETTTLLQRGVRRIALLGDSSPRSRAAEQVVRTLAARHGATVVSPNDQPGHRNALLVVGGWDTATRFLTADSRTPLHQRPIRSDGTWLAPWLLSPRVVDSTAGVVLPLAFDTRDSGPLAYRAALQRWFPDQAPTASGYQAWRALEHRTDGPPQLYAASRAAFMSMSDMGASNDAMPHEQQIAWFPGGTITPVEGAAR